MGEEELHRLLKGCLSNDRICQKQLYKAYYGFAMAICLRYANNRYEASEILNQGFFKMFANLGKYDPAKPFKAWLGRIMVNTSIDYYRANIKTNSTEELDNVHHLHGDNMADRNLSYNELIALVQQLPPAYRTVFNLYAIEGYQHDEIAKMLNISAGTSKSNLHKAREKLKVMITKGNAEPGTSGMQQTIRMMPVHHPEVKVSFLNNGTKQ